MHAVRRQRDGAFLWRSHVAKAGAVSTAIRMTCPSLVTSASAKCTAMNAVTMKRELSEKRDNSQSHVGARTDER